MAKQIILEGFKSLLSFLSLYLSMTSWTFQFVKKDFIHPIKSSSIWRSIIYLKSWAFAPWLNISFISINYILVSIFFDLSSCTTCTKAATLSIVNISFQASICLRCSLKRILQLSKSWLATIFSIILPI